MPLPGPAQDPEPVRRRERGLRRVGATTRLTAIAATGAALLLGTGYAHALPGISALASRAVEHSDTGDHPQPSTGAPVPTTQPAQTTTGAS